MTRLRLVPLALALPLLLGVGNCEPGDLAFYGEAEFQCVAKKQLQAGKYAGSAFKAWSNWVKDGDDAARDASLDAAEAFLANKFAFREAVSALNGVDCVDQTATAAELRDEIDAAVAAVVAAVGDGLDYGIQDHANCAKDILRAAGDRSKAYLEAQAQHTELTSSGGDWAGRDATQSAAADAFAQEFAAAACPTNATEPELAALLDGLAADTAFLTAVAPGLDDSEFQPVSPVGPIEYEGRELNPRCGFDANPDYHFFVKRGSVNKLVVYYQGGGACWENLTCGLPVCKDRANLIGDDPDNTTTGFGDLSNPDNPFKDWNAVFVTYCTCDIHYGDADQVYPGLFGPVDIKHRGFENAKVVEKFAREHFLNPDEIFVTGSSAGAYGALFHGPLLHEAWKSSHFSVLGDAGNGVITQSFLQNEFNNWNFQSNLPPEIPGVLESLTTGEGTPAYIDAIADYFPDSKWGHYTTAYDGGSGGQTGFYNVMLNNSNPLAALSWWNASCQFNDVMTDQAYDQASRAPENYRFYIGTGSRHTMYGSNKVYTDQTGGESQTIVDWVKDMIAFDPATSNPSDWENVECADCGIVLPGDPTPNTIPTPPFFNDGGQTVIECSL